MEGFARPGSVYLKNRGKEKRAQLVGQSLTFPLFLGILKYACCAGSYFKNWRVATSVLVMMFFV